MRIGMGYDVHRLQAGCKLIMGGVEIPYEKGLLGHSDADVLVHAVMDALLGAAALGDIGKHFPDTDPAYKGISSILLLQKVGELLEEHCFLIGNIDATIIAQAPKMRPHIDQMRQNMADALKIDVSQINVKATTEEGPWLYRSRRGYFCAGDLSVKQSDGTLRPECDQRLRRLRRLWRAVSPPVAWRNLCKVTGTLGQLPKLASEPSPAA